MEIIVQESSYNDETWTIIKGLEKEISLAQEELESKTCQYPKYHKKIYRCGDCIDLLTCKCDEAKEFKKAYEATIQLKKITHSEFIQFYDHKKGMEKLSGFLSNLQINKFKRKLSVIYAQIKKNYFSPFINKMKSIHFRIDFKRLKW